MDKWLKQVLLVCVCLLALTETFAADWRYDGNAKYDKVDVAKFYDADSIEHPNKDTVKFWLKFISEKALNNYDKKHVSEKLYLESIAHNIKTGYRPAFFELPAIKKYYSKSNQRGMTADEAALAAAAGEFTANSGDVQEIAKIYSEIDCLGKRMAVLSVTRFRPNGSIISQWDSDESPKYIHNAPDSSGEWLSLLLCPNS